MIGTDWLRRKAAGAVRIEEARPAAVAVVYRDPVPDPSMPGRLDLRAAGGPLIAYTASGAARIMVGPPGTAAATSGEPMRCPCGVIYSRCYYGH